jgi:hypothetical protein
MDDDAIKLGERWFATSGLLIRTDLPFDEAMCRVSLAARHAAIGQILRQDNSSTDGCA